MTSTHDPVAAVRRLFDAFGRGDLDALVATVHPDSRWSYYGANPRIGVASFTGREQVRRFFERILARLDVQQFDAREFVVDGDTVVVFGSESGTVRATGAPFRNEWAQKYVVRDGLITAMAEYNVQVEPRA
ncbi:MAG TPA: nuclear transport factor 2 family protein [Longimicrobiales bacterium]